jgi:hypothetical protein
MLIHAKKNYLCYVFGVTLWMRDEKGMRSESATVPAAVMPGRF